MAYIRKVQSVLIQTSLSLLVLASAAYAEEVSFVDGLGFNGFGFYISEKCKVTLDNQLANASELDKAGAVCIARTFQDVG